MQIGLKVFYVKFYTFIYNYEYLHVIYIKSVLSM